MLISEGRHTKRERERGKKIFSICTLLGQSAKPGEPWATDRLHIFSIFSPFFKASSRRIKKILYFTCWICRLEILYFFYGGIVFFVAQGYSIFFYREKSSSFRGLLYQKNIWKIFFIYLTCLIMLCGYIIFFCVRSANNGNKVHMCVHTDTGKNIKNGVQHFLCFPLSTERKENETKYTFCFIFFSAGYLGWLSIWSFGYLGIACYMFYCLCMRVQIKLWCLKTLSFSPKMFHDNTLNKHFTNSCFLFAPCSILTLLWSTLHYNIFFRPRKRIFFAGGKKKYLQGESKEGKWKPAQTTKKI